MTDGFHYLFKSLGVLLGPPPNYQLSSEDTAQCCEQVPFPDDRGTKDTYEFGSLFATALGNAVSIYFGTNCIQPCTQLVVFLDVIRFLFFRKTFAEQPEHLILKLKRFGYAENLG